MSGKRIVIEEGACLHGNEVGRCRSYLGFTSQPCPGGSRRTLTEGQYVLIEKVGGEWPVGVVENIVTGVNRGGPRAIWYDTVPRLLDDLLDALSDHTEGTP